MAIRGGILRRFLSTSPFASLTPPSPTPSAAPSTSLFVSGLNKRTTSEKLREAFAKFGEVVYARVITDRVNGFSKGYGFVTYSALEEAEKGIKGMDGQYKILQAGNFVSLIYDIEDYSEGYRTASGRLQ